MYDFQGALKDIKNKGLYREFRNVNAAQGPYTVIDGRKMLMMSSNNYLACVMI